MAPRKRQSNAIDDGDAAPVAKRRSARQAGQKVAEPVPETRSEDEETFRDGRGATKSKVASSRVTKKGASNNMKPSAKTASKPSKAAKKKPQPTEERDAGPSRAISEDAGIDSIPDRNPDVEAHDGEWYWLMKAEPETRYENGVDVSFSIDDLRARDEPEPWDGIRAYAARNNLRAMNLGDKSFFYHSNCKEPGIVGIMEIVKEYSEDRSARRPGTPYYDPSSTKEKPKWGLVHVKFVKKFAVPIGLKELREMGHSGKPLEQMQMLKQSRLSVSKVSRSEWVYLCQVADTKAREAGLEHETGN